MTRREIGWVERILNTQVDLGHDQWRQQFNVASLRDAGVWTRDWHHVAADPEVEDEPNGLTWYQLTAAVCGAVAQGG